MLMEEEKGEELDLKAKMEASLIMCSKAGNIQGCEDALDQDAFIDCKDDHGNTPLLLAASCKMLLLVRRWVLLPDHHLTTLQGSTRQRSRRCQTGT